MSYISFSPYYSGLSNVIMSYELAMAISHITNRTLILPKDCFIHPHTNQTLKKGDFKDIWKFFDREVAEKEFKLIDFDNIGEYKSVKKLIESDRSYTANIGDHVSDIVVYTQKLVNDHLVVVNDHKRFLGNHDFLTFSSGRPILDLNVTNKFLHFEANLFGHFWYNIYLGNSHERNILKDKINIYKESIVLNAILNII